MLTQTLNREKKEKTKTVRHKFKSDAYPNIKQRKKKGREANFHHHGLKTHHHGENPNIKQRKKRKRKNKEAKDAKYLRISVEKAEKEVGGWRVKHCVTVTWRGGLAELGSVRAVRASFKLVVLLEWR